MRRQSEQLRPPPRRPLLRRRRLAPPERSPNPDRSGRIVLQTGRNTMKSSATLGATAFAAILSSALLAPATAQTHPNFNGIYGGAGVGDLKATTCGEKVDAFSQSSNERYKAGAVGGAAEGSKGAAGWITFEQDCG